MKSFIGYFVLTTSLMQATSSNEDAKKTIEKLRQEVREGNEVSKQILIDLYKKAHKPAVELSTSSLSPQIRRKLNVLNLVDTAGKINGEVENYIKTCKTTSKKKKKR